MQCIGYGCPPHDTERLHAHALCVACYQRRYHDAHVVELAAYQAEYRADPAYAELNRIYARAHRKRHK